MTHLISTPAEVSKSGAKVRKAIAGKVPVVNEDFLEAVVIRNNPKWEDYDLKLHLASAVINAVPPPVMTNVVSPGTQTALVVVEQPAQQSLVSRY